MLQVIVIYRLCLFYLMRQKQCAGAIFHLDKHDNWLKCQWSQSRDKFHLECMICLVD